MLDDWFVLRPFAGWLLRSTGARPRVVQTVSVRFVFWVIVRSPILQQTQEKCAVLRSYKQAGGKLVHKYELELVIQGLTSLTEAAALDKLVHTYLVLQLGTVHLAS